MTRRHKLLEHAALGGTFDRFHRGHRAFLRSSFQQALRVTIGITDDRFAEKLHPSPILESYKKRRDSLQRFLMDRGIQERSKVVTLSDVFGTAIEDDSLQALLVTKNTLQGARKINQERRKRKKVPLQIIKLGLTQALDRIPISSQRIRRGEIDREGVVYARVLLDSTPVRLPQFLRERFRKPFGWVISAESRQKNQVMEEARRLASRKKLSPIVSVGDVVTQQALRIGWKPSLAIVDLRVKRRRRFRTISQIADVSGYIHKRVVNPSGVILEKLVRLLKAVLQDNQKTLIQIEGEEDLAVLPTVLLAPLNCAVIYGHFQYGVIIVEVTEEKKSEALKLLQQLRRTPDLG